MMKNRAMFYVILISLSLVAVCVHGQSKKELDSYYTEHLQLINDTTIQNNKLFLDTLLLNLDSIHTALVDDYDKYYRDSVYAQVKDSINQVRKDELLKINNTLKTQFDGFYHLKKDSIRNIFSDFAHTLNNHKLENSECKDCRNKENANDRLDEYTDLLDSLSDQFQDRVSFTADTIQSIIEDSLDACKDSLTNYAGNLIDQQMDELESVHDRTDSLQDAREHIKESEEPDENVSSLDIDMIYSSHDSYRGRDNGYPLNSLSPTITYADKHGFSIYTSLTWLNKPNNPLDEIDLGASYDIDFSDALSLSIGYEHSWFRDTVLAKSLLDNTVEAALGLDVSWLVSDFVFDLNFGGGNSESNIAIDLNFPIILSKNFIKGKLTLEPGGTVNYGSQNSDLVAQRRLKGNRMLGNSKKSNVFGIMDYELALPLILDFKVIIIKPQLEYIFPVNVLDNSTKDPFFNFSLELNVPFRFK